jgi:ankyrin repeat protein
LKAKFIYEYLELPSKSKEQIKKDLALLPKEKLNTLLIKAAREGSVDKVKWLLDAGADIENADTFGWTALIWALFCKNKEAAQVLKAAGAKEHYDRLNKLLPSKTSEQIIKDLSLLPKKDLDEMLLYATYEDSLK